VSGLLIFRTGETLLAALGRVHPFVVCHSGPGRTLSVAAVEGQQHAVCVRAEPGSTLAESLAGLS
jgi:hypothetical protein